MLLCASDRQRAGGRRCRTAGGPLVWLHMERCVRDLMGTLNQMWANHQLTSLSVADQVACLSSNRRTDGQTSSSPARLPAAPVLTLYVAGLLLARLSTLVEGKLSGKEVLFTLVIERLLRKRSEVGRRRGQRQHQVENTL